MIRAATRPAGIAETLTLVVGLSALAGGARAAWLPFGNPVAAVTGEQIWPRIVADEQGGAFVTWAEDGNVRVQHMAHDGGYFTGWSDQGLILPPAASPMTNFRIDPITSDADGEGGVYELSSRGGPCWAHCGGVRTGLLAVQRLTADGRLARGWPTSGLLPFLDQHDERADDRAQLVSDGSHGALVSIGEWTQAGPLGPIVRKVLRVQSIAPDTTRRWGESGVVVSTDLGLQAQTALLGDGHGGAFVLWACFDSASARMSLHGQHVSERGRCLWGDEGHVLSRLPSSAIGGPLAVLDGKELLLAWTSGTGPAMRMYATRVTPDGKPGWKTERPLRRSAGQVSGLEIVVARGGAIAAWLDAGTNGPAGIYAQRIMHSGHAPWGDGGVAVCTAPGGHGQPQLASDGRDGVYIAWSDTRVAGKLYATHLDARGQATPGWSSDGTVISPWVDSHGYATDPVEGPFLASNARGEAMVVWDSWERVLSRSDVVFVEQAFVRLFTPSGPAASPVAASRKPDALAEPAGVSPNAPRLAFALRGVWPNPASAGASVSFALPDASPATLELFDVAGRRVWTREVGELGAGEHVVRLRDGAASPPGLYLVRLRQGGRVASTRVVIVSGLR